jgi:N-methylhydantoinase B
MRPAFDPITLQLLWNRLIGIVDEAAITLVRTSFSQVVQECNDYSCTLMDADGNALADNPSSIPAFIGTLPRTMRHILAVFPKETWKPGDAVITNDPWMGTGHLLDFTMVAPVFRGGRLVAFAGAVAHAVDVGGLSWASHAREVFEEGIRIPICRFIEAGRPNLLLIEIIRANVRQPDLVIGDFMAMLAATEITRQRVLEFLDDAKLEELGALADAIHGQAEVAMRAAIRAVPDGVYRHGFDIDGFDHTLRIEAKLTIAGDALEMDYAGTSPQVARGINSVMNYTYAYTAYPLKCALDPITPKNEGSYRPIAVTAPEGSILNPRFPAAVSARHLTGMYCAAAAFGCLAQAIPDRVMADSSGPPSRPVFHGTGADGRAFSLIMFPWGGMGARANADGLPCTAFPGNDNCATVEAMEAAAPVRFLRKEIIRDSGGIGRFQGGAGQEITLEFVAPSVGTLAMMSARFRTPAHGLLGGGPGSLTQYLINGVAVPPNGREELKPGDLITIRYPGGGGYGDPKTRDPALVARDVRDGVVSAEHATRSYGPAWRERSAAE